MAQSNHERVGKALDVPNAGLCPFVEREVHAAYGNDWVARAGSSTFDPQPASVAKNQTWTRRCRSA